MRFRLCREEGLSEVIGFILIVALITIVVSLYMTYVVPAQGRDAEIALMDYIQDQFAGFKISADSLIVNRETGVSLGRPMVLGTGGGTSQGAFLNIPLVQPVPSGGTLVINGRGDRIAVTADGYRAVSPAAGDREPAAVTRTINISPAYSDIPASVAGIAPEHVFIVVNTNQSAPGTGVSDLTVPGSWPQTSSVVIGNRDDPDWALEIRAVPVTDIFNVSGSTYTYNLTYDLRVIVRNTTTIGANPAANLPQEFTIQRRIAPGTDYAVDLMDYIGIIPGIRDRIAYPMTMRASVHNSGPVLTAWYQVVYPYATTGTMSLVPPYMGSFEYRSANHYWIQQDYYYQEGGIFLKQADGMAPRVLPLISASVRNGSLGVKMSHIRINGQGSTASTGQVQVRTEVEGITRLADGFVNAQRVTITVTPSGDDAARAAAMWAETFRRICGDAALAGVPYVPGSTVISSANWMVVQADGSGATLILDGPNRATGSILDPYDVQLDLTLVDLLVSVGSPASGVL